jgi:hypothetical protein
MADVEYGDDVAVIVYFVDHAIIADTDAPAFAPGQFSATRRSRIVAEGANRITDMRKRCCCRTREFPLRAEES